MPATNAEDNRTWVVDLNLKKNVVVKFECLIVPMTNMSTETDAVEKVATD